MYIYTYTYTHTNTSTSTYTYTYTYTCACTYGLRNTRAYSSVLGHTQGYARTYSGVLARMRECSECGRPPRTQ